VTSEQLGSETNNDFSVAPNMSIKILKDFVIGVNPVPEQSLQTLRFFEIESASINLLYEIDPIKNDQWEILERDFPENSYGLTVYQFTVTNADLN